MMMPVSGQRKPGLGLAWELRGLAWLAPPIAGATSYMMLHLTSSKDQYCHGFARLDA